MEKFEHYSDCSVLVTKLTIAKSPNKKGFLVTVEDQIRKKELTACISNEMVKQLVFFLTKQKG